MNKKIRQFIGEAILEMVDSKVSINLLRTRRIKLSENMYTNGGFNEEPLEFSCAMSKPQKEWIQIDNLLEITFFASCHGQGQSRCNSVLR